MLVVLEAYWLVSFRNFLGTTSSRFDRPILGTLAPLAGLSQLQTLIISVDYGNPMKFEGQILGLCGYNKRDFSFALRFCIGTLEPISGLVQLEQLYLRYCRNLTGTICCSGTTSELTHWWSRRSSSATEPESIDVFEPRIM